MLTFFGRSVRHCDRLHRRTFLQAGALGFAGLTLADLLRAEAAAGTGSSEKAVINIHLDGGPPQLDTIDLKPAAPVEIRGEFAPISTRIPGVQISELMPRVASIADRFAFIRTLTDSAGAHDAFQCQSGYRKRDLQSLGGRPAVGCVLSKLRGSAADTAPSFVDLMQGRPLVRNSARPGFLGPSFAPFRPDISAQFERPLESGMKGELARLGKDHTVSMRLNPELSLARLDDRRALLGQLDRIRGEIDASGMMDAMDRFSQQAASMLTSGRFADAMDLSQEDPAVLARYTAPPDRWKRSTTSEGPEAPRKLLLARRCIEAGVRCVSVSISDFDTHRENFPRMRQLLPIVDHGLHALVTDLEERGMLENTTIVVWGEFGRTPRVDPKTGGRHHWPRVGPCLMAGGGLRTGQAIGVTDRVAGSPVERPVTYQEVFATLYHRLGIDLSSVTLTDPTGRPQYLTEVRQPIRELV